MKQLKLSKLFNFLISVGLITVLIMFTFGGLLFFKYQSIFEKEKQWMVGFSSYVELTKIVVSGNAPGNRVFDNLDVKKERSEFDKYYNTAISKIESLEKKLKSNNDPETKNLFLEIKKGVETSKESTYKIFSNIERNRINDATKEMSSLDENFHKILINISKLKLILAKNEVQEFSKNYNWAKSIFILTGFICLLILFSMLSLFYFGKKIERQIKEREKELTNYEMAVNSHSIVAKTRKNGVITYVNENFCQISGFSEEELIGKTHAVVNSGYHPKEFFKNMWDTILAGKKWRGQVKNKAKDGSFYWVDTTITPITDEKGEILEFMAIRNEISTQKEQEEDLLNAKEKAIKAESIKSEFLANMSHEIRTPLNGVLGVLQLLSLSKLNLEQKELLETAKISGETLLTIINDVLDISKIESGKFDLEEINFCLENTLEESLALLEHKAKSKNVNFIFKKDRIPHWFKGDVTRIRQIIVNYLSNAVKFTENGDVEIYYKLKSVSDNETEIKISVKDSGVGIKKENIEKLFNPFTQEDSSTTRRFGGTGLGLSICKKLAELMGGSVFVTSEYGKGSTFGVTFILQNGMSELKDNSQKIQKDFNVASDFPHKILVVEDNSVNQKLMKMMLKKLGYECDIAGDGIEVLKLLELVTENRTQMYSTIFMDMQMPELGGIDTAKEIIKIYGDNAPRIIAMTANAFKEDRDACSAAGMRGFLPKPIKFDDLIELLSNGEIKKAS